MTEAPSTTDDPSELARRLGQRSGHQTKRRGSAYYARIGRLGALKRWHPEHDDGANSDRAEGDDVGSSVSSEADRDEPSALD